MGNLSDIVEYSPYGESDEQVSNFGFAGEWSDPTTGFNYNKARWYDKTEGVFLSIDPIVQITNAAFDYANGNPLQRIDPLGLYYDLGEEFDWIYDNSGGISVYLVGIGLLLKRVPGASQVIISFSVGLSIVGAWEAHSREEYDSMYANIAASLLGVGGISNPVLGGISDSISISSGSFSDREEDSKSKCKV